jgi:alanine dehydrogenase
LLVGVPKEIKNNENRVAMTPAGVQELISRGHSVLIETSAGTGSGFSDDDYAKAGAQIAKDADSVWSKAELIVKVKEPIAQMRLSKAEQLRLPTRQFRLDEPFRCFTQ